MPAAISTYINELLECAGPARSGIRVALNQRKGKQDVEDIDCRRKEAAAASGRG